MGEIVDFNRSRKNPPVKILGTKMPTTDVNVVDVSRQVQKQPFEIRRHEEIAVIRQRKKDGLLDLRFRAARDKKAWDKARKAEDD